MPSTSTSRFWAAHGAGGRLLPERQRQRENTAGAGQPIVPGKARSLLLQRITRSRTAVRSPGRCGPRRHRSTSRRTGQGAPGLLSCWPAADVTASRSRPSPAATGWVRLNPRGPAHQPWAAPGDLASEAGGFQCLQSESILSAKS
jgi:hypothetical protein